MFGFLKSASRFKQDGNSLESLAKSPQVKGGTNGGGGAGPRYDDSWSLELSGYRSEIERLLSAGSYREAERYLESAIARADRRLGSPATRCRMRLDLAEVGRQRAHQGAVDDFQEIFEPDAKRLEAAQVLIREAIQIAGDAGERAAYLEGLDALADIFSDQKNYAALDKLEQEALRLASTLGTPDPQATALRWYRLGLAQHELGRYEESVTALETAVHLYEDLLGMGSAGIAELYYQVGRMYRAQAQYEDAAILLRDALRILEAQYGHDSIQAFYALQQLAATLEESGDLDGAAAQYERVLLLKLRRLGLGNLDEVAEMQYNLANLHVGWGNLARARELLTECIGAFNRAGGPRLAVSHEILAQVEEGTGLFHSAVKHLKEAAKIWETCGPEKIPERIRNLEYCAELHDNLNRTREAAWMRAQAADLRVRLDPGEREAAPAPVPDILAPVVSPKVDRVRRYQEKLSSRGRAQQPPSAGAPERGGRRTGETAGTDPAAPAPSSAAGPEGSRDSGSGSRSAEQPDRGAHDWSAESPQLDTAADHTRAGGEQNAPNPSSRVGPGGDVPGDTPADSTPTEAAPPQRRLRLVRRAS